MQRTHVILATGALALVGVAGWLYHEVNVAPAEAAPALASSPVASAAVTSPPPPRGDGPAMGRVPPPPPPSEPTPDPAITKSPSPWAAQLRSGVSAQGFKPGLAAGSSIGPPDPNDPKKADPQWDAILSEVNKQYDRGDYDEAKADAIKLLAKDPGNVRLLRVVVSSSCLTGDAADAQTYYEKLTDKRDRDQMRTRCERNQVTLTDPK